MNEATAREGVEHLRAAAYEAIAAARAFLDVIEDALQDPAQAAARLLSAADATPSPPEGPSTEPRVTRIPLS